MKKILIITAALLYGLTSNAQKNSWYAGGEVGLQFKKIETAGSNNSAASEKFNSWRISPEIGTFLTDHVQLGLGLTLQGTKLGDAKTSLTGGTVYSRYFFGSGAFRPFAGFNVSALPGKTTQGGSERTIKNFNFSANLNAGFGYALSDRITAVGSFGTLGFISETQKNSSTGMKNTVTGFGLDAGSLGNRFNVGIYYTFK